jgi:hypothetical protein
MRRLVYVLAVTAMGCFSQSSPVELDAGGGPDGGTINLPDSATGNVDAGAEASGPSGFPVLSPAVVELGTTNCGSIAKPQPLKIENQGDAPLTITALTFAQGLFTASGVTLPHVLAPGASVNVDIGAVATPRAEPKKYTDTLNVTTSVGVRSIVANEDVTGVLLDWNPSPLAFTVNTGGLHNRTVTVRNRGTQAATIRVTRDASSSIYIDLTALPPSTIAAGGGTGDGTIQFTARAQGTHNGKLHAIEVSNAPKCGASTVDLDIAATYQP